jgi:hypothetical protein
VKRTEQKIIIKYILQYLEEQRFRVLQNVELRGIFGPKKEEVTRMEEIT